MSEHVGARHSTKSTQLHLRKASMIHQTITIKRQYHPSCLLLVIKRRIFLLAELELHQLVEPLVFLLVLVLKFGDLVPSHYLLLDCGFWYSCVATVDLFFFVLILHPCQLIDVSVLLKDFSFFCHALNHDALDWVFWLSAWWRSLRGHTRSIVIFLKICASIVGRICLQGHRWLHFSIEFGARSL